MITPQVTLTSMLGSMAPSVDMLPRTKVAESPEVTKKMLTSTSATTEMIGPKGREFRDTNRDWGRLLWAMLAMLASPERVRFIARPP